MMILMQTFKKGKIKAVVIFPEDLAALLTRDGHATVSIIADASEPNTASLVTGYTSGILNDYSAALTKHITTGLPVISPEVRMYFNPNLESHFMFVPGVITLTTHNGVGTDDIRGDSPRKGVRHHGGAAGLTAETVADHCG